MIRFATRWFAAWWLTEFVTGFASEWRSVAADRRASDDDVGAVVGAVAGDVRASALTVTPSEQAEHLASESTNGLVTSRSHSAD